MLKRYPSYPIRRGQGQPPSGGCVLKQLIPFRIALITFQPPSGGCVLKPEDKKPKDKKKDQPPSGGCVLKPP